LPSPVFSPLHALVEVDFAKLALWRRVGAALVEDARG